MARPEFPVYRFGHPGNHVFLSFEKQKDQTLPKTLNFVISLPLTNDTDTGRIVYPVLIAFPLTQNPKYFWQ